MLLLPLYRTGTLHLYSKSNVLSAACLLPGRSPVKQNSLCFGIVCAVETASESEPVADPVLEDAQWPTWLQEEQVPWKWRMEQREHAATRRSPGRGHPGGRRVGSAAVGPRGLPGSRLVPGFDFRERQTGSRDREQEAMRIW